MSFSSLIEISTLPYEKAAAVAKASARAEEAEAEGCISKYKSAQAKMLMGELDLESKATHRNRLLDYLSTYNYERGDLRAMSTKELEELYALMN